MTKTVFEIIEADEGYRVNELECINDRVIWRYKRAWFETQLEAERWVARHISVKLQGSGR